MSYYHYLTQEYFNGLQSAVINLSTLAGKWNGPLQIRYVLSIRYEEEIKKLDHNVLNSKMGEDVA